LTIKHYVFSHQNDEPNKDGKEKSALLRLLLEKQHETTEDSSATPEKGPSTIIGRKMRFNPRELGRIYELWSFHQVFYYFSKTRCGDSNKIKIGDFNFNSTQELYDFR